MLAGGGQGDGWVGGGQLGGWVLAGRWATWRLGGCSGQQRPAAAVAFRLAGRQRQRQRWHARPRGGRLRHSMCGGVPAALGQCPAAALAGRGCRVPSRRRCAPAARRWCARTCGCAWATLSACTSAPTSSTASASMVSGAAAAAVACKGHRGWREGAVSPCQVRQAHPRAVRCAIGAGWLQEQGWGSRGRDGCAAA